LPGGRRDFLPALLFPLLQDLDGGRSLRQASYVRAFLLFESVPFGRKIEILKPDVTREIFLALPFPRRSSPAEFPDMKIEYSHLFFSLPVGI